MKVIIRDANIEFTASLILSGFQPLSTKHSTYKTRCKVPLLTWVLIQGAQHELLGLGTRLLTLSGLRPFAFCNLVCLVHLGVPYETYKPLMAI